MAWQGIKVNTRRDGMQLYSVLRQLSHESLSATHMHAITL